MSYFQGVQKAGGRVDRATLLGDEFISPLNAGLSCLAALPSQVNYLVPQPYKQLSTDNRVEDIYGRCMDPDNNVFDMQLFEQLCTEAIGDSNTRNQKRQEKKTPARRSNLRKVRTGDTFWTVIGRVRSPLVHPFEPPMPFSDRLSYLRNNPHIKSSHILASDRPRWLRNESMQGSKANGREKRADIDACDMGELLVNALGDDTGLEEVEYKMVYQSGEVVTRVIKGKKDKLEKDGKKDKLEKQTNVKLEKPGKNNAKLEKQTSVPSAISVPIVKEEYATKAYEITRMKKVGMHPPEKSIYNPEKFNALQCLQQLYDADLICSLEWDYQTPSKSKYAADYPYLYEEVRVSVTMLANADSLTVCQDRNTKVFSRKIVKHSIAGDIMKLMFEKHGEWSSMTVREMKALLVPPHKVDTTAEDMNALQCLHQLKDARCFELSWDFHLHSETKEIARLSIKRGELNFVLEESRHVYQDSKASMKHRLAGKAMENIMADSGKNWKSMTVSELKDHLII